MMQNKKGLSTIVVTLIIIVLSLVAVGVVWVIVNNLLKSGTANAEINSKCLGVSLEVTKVVCGTTSPELCNITVSRTGTGNDVLAGIKMYFQEANGTRTATLISQSGDVPPLIGKNYDLIASSLTNPVSIEVTPYFADESGNQQICQQQSTFKFG